MKDLVSKLGVVPTLAPAVQAATAKGTTVDLQGFNSAALIVNTGAIAGAGLYVMSLQESDTTTDGDFTDVAAGDMQGTLPASLAENTAYKVGYKGTKRYLRGVITKTSGTSIACGAVIVKGAAASSPVA